MDALQCRIAEFAAVGRLERVLGLCLIRVIVQWDGRLSDLVVLGPAFGKDLRRQLQGRRNTGFRGKHVTGNLPLCIPLHVIARSLGFEFAQRVHLSVRQQLHLFCTWTRTRARVLDTSGGVQPELLSAFANRIDVDRVAGSLAIRRGIVQFVKNRS